MIKQYNFYMLIAHTLDVNININITIT